jgi:hypothetical protein
MLVCVVLFPFPFNPRSNLHSVLWIRIPVYLSVCLCQGGRTRGVHQTHLKSERAQPFCWLPMWSMMMQLLRSVRPYLSVCMLVCFPFSWRSGGVQGNTGQPCDSLAVCGNGADRFPFICSSICSSLHHQHTHQSIGSSIQHQHPSVCLSIQHQRTHLSIHPPVSLLRGL